MLNLGINSDSISYEVALDVLGGHRQPFMQAIHEERRNAYPSQAFIRYCEDRLAVSWRAQALRGDREAYGLAHALEVVRRRRLCDS